MFDLFPENGEDVSRIRFDARAGGSPFNVAIGIARMGRRSALLTGISTDFLGERLAAALRAEGVATDYLIRKSAPTTLSLVGVGADGSPQYAFYGEGASDRLVKSSELPAFPDSVLAVHLGSYSIAVPPVADALTDLVRREKGRRFLSLDPNIRLNVVSDVATWRRRVENLAAQVDLLKISLEDIETLYPDEAPERLAARWLEAGVALVVVTRGGGGIYGATGRLTVEVPVTPMKVVDTVGAGDTFQAGVLTALDELGMVSRAAVAALDEETLVRILGFAARAAMITCSRRGADLPRRSELGEL